MSDSLRPHESQHARPPCPSLSPGVHSDSCPLSPWCHPAISSSVVPFSSCPQSLPASESFPMSQLFAWGVQSIGASSLASFLPKKSQGWSRSEWTGWISLQSKGLSRVFSNTTVTWLSITILFLSILSQWKAPHYIVQKFTLQVKPNEILVYWQFLSHKWTITIHRYPDHLQPELGHVTGTFGRNGGVWIWNEY